MKLFYKNIESGNNNMFIHMTTEDGKHICEQLPTKKSTCPKCKGKGDYTDPTFSDGIEANRKLYSIECVRCDGKGMVDVPDKNACKPEVWKRYIEIQKELKELKSAASPGPQ